MDLTLTAERPHALAFQHYGDAPCVSYASLDPMSADQPEDAMVVTTGRRLQRLATVACDAGARFAREGLAEDAADWMTAPRALFDGASAIEACQGREAFLRATLLHGLSLGLDADPAELDALLCAGDDGEHGWSEDRLDQEVPASAVACADVLLYTATVEGRFGNAGRCVQAFCAMVAADEEVVRRRLRVRYGERLGSAAVVQPGFDPAGALARSLLSTGVSRMLSAVASDPAGELGAGLDVQVEQRFAA